MNSKSNTKKSISYVDRIHAIGRRKASTARVFLTPGKGEITINGRTTEDYFGGCVVHHYNAFKPLEAVGVEGQFDLMITTKSGGIKGQAGAIRLAIARALIAFQMKQEDLKEAVECAWHSILKKGGYLRRNAAKVERQKIGRKGARADKQFSKR